MPMLTLQEIAELLGSNPENHLPAELAGREVGAFRLDSRQVEPGDLFLCLPGEKVDGHDFAAQAAQSGAIAVIAERDPFAGATPPLAVIRVENCQRAIAGLAAHWRERAADRGVKVVGITGTAGKTSVKEVLSAVLGVRGKTCKNFMNMNNQLGLPVSMLNAADDALFWVLEAGISEARDMDELGALLRPDLAVILNVGPGHLSGLGDKGVAHYKSRLLAHLAPGGSGLVNADYPDLVRESRAFAAPKHFFSSRSAEAEIYAIYLGPDSAAGGRYQIRQLDESGATLSFSAAAPFRGGFGAENVAAIAGAALLLGLQPEEIRRGLPLAVLPRQRFNCQLFENTLLVDDSYNSNPLSAGRMLDAAAEMARERKLPLFLVMGEMLELGEEADAVHRELGCKMAASGARAVFWKGGRSEHIRAGLEAGGYGGAFRCTQVPEEFEAAMREIYAGSGVILFKASRGNRLEQFVSLFQNEFCNQ